jgi:dTDP-4-amino-4,6-dideoxygalactose transaminase
MQDNCGFAQLEKTSQFIQARMDIYGFLKKASKGLGRICTSE